MRKVLHATMIILASCAGHQNAVAPGKAPGLLTAPAAATVAKPQAATPALSQAAALTSPEPVVLVDQPDVLQALDLAIGPVLFDVDETSTLRLRKSRRYRELSYRMRAIDASIPRWWLRSSKTSFELVAVLNRLDRRDLVPGTCGETRLVYRLIHTRDNGTTEALPLALNVLFAQPDVADACRSVAQSWQVEDVADLVEDGGPLSAIALAYDNLLAVESNVRAQGTDAAENTLMLHLPNPEPRWDRAPWDNGVLEFNPQAMYKGRGWPRVTELLSAPEMRRAIFDGIPNMKDHGISYPEWDETGTDPFTAVEALLPEDGDYAPFSDKAAFLARARSLTCGGCHQTRSVDGFHVALGSSAHLDDEAAWRRDYVRAVAKGDEPLRTRPFSPPKVEGITPSGVTASNPATTASPPSSATPSGSRGRSHGDSP